MMRYGGIQMIIQPAVMSS